MFGLDSLTQDILGSLDNLAWVVAFVSLVVGLAFTYFGLRIYKIIVFLSGFIFGAIVGYGAGYLGGGHLLAILLAFGVGFLFGFLSLLFTYVAIFLLGMLLGGVLAVVFGVDSGLLMLLCVIGGGAAAVAIHDLAIVIATAFTGANMLLYFFMIVWTYAGTNWVLTPESFLGFLENMYTNLLHGMRGLMVWPIICLCIFISGVLVQLNLTPKFGNGTNRNKGKAKSQRAVSVSNEDTSDWTVDYAPESSSPASGATPEPARQHSSEQEEYQDEPAYEEPATDIPPMQPARDSNAPGYEPPPSAPPLWTLSILKNDALLESRELAAGSYLLGRSATCDIHVADSAVSERHLRITVGHDASLTLTDLGSTNGTLLGGTQPIATTTPEEGEWFLAGGVQLTFHRC